MVVQRHVQEVAGRQPVIVPVRAVVDLDERPVRILEGDLALGKRRRAARREGPGGTEVKPFADLLVEAISVYGEVKT